MKSLVKSIEGLPRIVKFIFTLIWGILANIYRLARSAAKGNVVGVILAVILLICGGFVVLWIFDLICIVLSKDIWWID